MDVRDYQLHYGEHPETQYEEAERIIHIQKIVALYEVLFKWKGLPDEVNLTWEPKDKIHSDIPLMHW